MTDQAEALALRRAVLFVEALQTVCKDAITTRAKIEGPCPYGIRGTVRCPRCGNSIDYVVDGNREISGACRTAGCLDLKEDAKWPAPKA
jgi:hypothetical protein